MRNIERVRDIVFVYKTNMIRYLNIYDCSIVAHKKEPQNYKYKLSAS